MSKYRDHVMHEAKKRPRHPINHGIDMQAHHLVSRFGIELTLGLATALIELGYNIDALNNLVLLPSTLPGACHLKVQLHRGDHVGGDVDSISYHKYVAKCLILLRIQESRGRLCTLIPKQIQAKVDKISHKILKRIRDFKLPLTQIHYTFKRGATSGCCGKRTVDDARVVLDKEDSVARCPRHRDHGFDVSSYTLETYGDAEA
jgi:hypothetical protein